MNFSSLLAALVLVCLLLSPLNACTTSAIELSNLKAQPSEAAIKAGETPLEMIKSGAFEYPRFARANGIEGRIVLKVKVSADGNVEEILVLKRELNKYQVWTHNGREGKWDDVTHIFDEPAEDMVKTAKWKPASRDGVAISRYVVLPLIFKLDN